MFDPSDDTYNSTKFISLVVSSIIWTFAYNDSNCALLNDAMVSVAPEVVTPVELTRSINPTEVVPTPAIESVNVFLTIFRS